MTIDLFEVFEPTADYKSSVLFAANSSNDRYRRETAQYMLKQAGSSNASPNKRYRVALDALHVLGKQAPSAPPKTPTDLVPLTKALKALQVGKWEDPGVVAEASKVVAEIQNTTWQSFEDMKESPFGQQVFDADTADGLNDYDRWFKEASPYLGIALPEAASKAEAVLQERIGFLCSKLTMSPSGDPLGLAERYRDDAWEEVRRVWSLYQSVDTAAA